MTVYVESDENIENIEQAYEMACERWIESDVGFTLKGLDGAAAYEINGIYLGEELSSHVALNRGNVCHAVVPETSWETEDHKRKEKG